MERMSLAGKGEAATKTYLDDGQISEGELRRRAQFMEKQRELLTEKKRVERQRQLEQYVRSQEQEKRANGGPEQRWVIW